MSEQRNSIRRAAVPAVVVLVCLGCHAGGAEPDSGTGPAADDALGTQPDAYGWPKASPAPVDQDGAGNRPVALAAWPADGTVAIACAKDAFGTNLSGLVYEPASAAAGAMLWAVQNQPSKLYRRSYRAPQMAPLAAPGVGTVHHANAPVPSGKRA